MGLSESKIAFKQSVFKVAGEDLIQPEDGLWEELWTFPESADDVFNIWLPNEIRQLTYTKPADPRHSPTPGQQVEPHQNLQTLLYMVIARLKTHQMKVVYDNDATATNREVLNCLRILTRVFPFIFEAEHLRAWYDRFFWQQRKPYPLWQPTEQKMRYFDGLDTAQVYSQEDINKELGQPLGEILLNVAVHFLFFKGFTLPMVYDQAGNPDLNAEVKVWQTGIGCSISPNCTQENLRNQYETVRFLLTMTSSTLFLRPEQVAHEEIKALTHLTTKIDKRVVNAINCSILNTVLRFNPNYWGVPTGWQVGVRDTKRLLVMNCIQFLLVAMIYLPPTDAPGQGKNLFRSSIGALFRPDDFQFIHNGINMVISQPLNASKYSISKDDTVQWAPEMISFFWELVQCNKRFRRYLTETKVGMDYLVVLLYYAMDSMEDVSKQGMLRMAVFVLQTLTAERTFAAKLNQEFSYIESLPLIMRVTNFHGSYADFLVCSVYSLFKSSKGRNENLYPALLNIVKNVCPYQMNLQRATSSKIMSLFEMLSAPGFFMQHDTNGTMLRSLLEGIQAVLDNQAQHNPHFVQVLVANKSRFQALQRLTVDSALAELDREAMQRKDRPGAVRPSIESPRVRASERAPSLGDINEDSRFTIGDDDDDDDDDEQAEEKQKRSSSTDRRISTASTATARAEAAADGSVLHSTLSEKARGKKPAAVNTSRATISRNTSTSSVPSVTSSTPTTRSATLPFQPSQQWLDAWLAQLPLNSILAALDRAEAASRHVASSRSSTAFQNPDADLSRPPSTSQRGQHRGQTGQPTEFSRQSHDGTHHEQHRPTAQTAHGADGQGHLDPGGTAQPAAGGPVTFQWTAVAIGWYNALIWSRIYLQEAEAFQGSGGLYSSTDIRLFRRQGASQEISLRRPKGAIDAVGNSLAQRISSISISKAN